jgi:hypothetical protein
MIRNNVSSIGASLFMIFLIAIGALLTESHIFLQASTDGGDDSSGGESGEGESTDGEGSDENESNDSDNGDNDDESPATTPVSPTDPSAAKEAEREGQQKQDGNNGDNSGHLPYCDTPEGEAAQSCHDKEDYDEVIDLYPCNDGSQKANPDDCPDATKPVVGNNNNPSLHKTISFGTFSVQGSAGPVEQIGPIPIPKAGEALLKIIYEGEWSGSILDSGFDSASYDGTGNYVIIFPCIDGGIYSLSAQKSEDGNDLMQLILQDSTNATLDQGQTTAEFGIVSLYSEC